MKFTKKERPSPQIQITSLIDIIFILLIFFMISSTFIRPATHVRLPVSATREEAPDQNMITITLTEDDSLYLEKDKVSFENFQTELLDRISTNSNEVVALFYGDSGISFEKFMVVMDILKSSGIRGIAISHKEE